MQINPTTTLKSHFGIPTIYLIGICNCNDGVNAIILNYGLNRVGLKDFFEMRHLPVLFDKVIPNLRHENDGLIFTPKSSAYVPGTCRKLYLLLSLCFKTFEYLIS